MPLDKCRVVVRRFFDEGFNSGELFTIRDSVSIGYIEHTPLPGQLPGYEGVKQILSMLHNAFADLHFHVEDMILEGNKVVVRGILSGTHCGKFMGIPPTGKRFTAFGIHVYRVEAGKIMEHWGDYDHLGIMQQLGVIPAPRTDRVMVARI